VKKNIRQCKICYNLAESDTCPICADPKRDKSIICVVEQPKDVIGLEKTGLCKWVYHVLNGHIAPLEGVEPADLTIDALTKRVRTGGVKEVVMATNPNLEGDGTALYIHSLLSGLNVKITRLARGLPAGSTIEYASGNILADAILGRSPL
jgi:recombination protein RecR